MLFTEKWKLLLEQLQEKNEKQEQEIELLKNELLEKDAKIAEQEQRCFDVVKRLEVLEENVRNINSTMEIEHNNWTGRIEGVETYVNERFVTQDAKIAAIDGKMATLEAQNADMESIRVNLRNNNKHVEDCLTQVKEYKDAVNRITFQAAGNDSDNSNAYGSIDYFDFENHFRGSREMIKNNQKSYVKFFEGCKKVVDIGCGRGEFLELMKENGIGAVGVDTYTEFVDFCKERQLNVVEQDAVEYLLNCDSTDGIFAGQLVEHLKVEQIIALCRIAYDKLEPGKCLIMETPNPMSLAIYTHAFYLDPSHMKPVHPLLLEYIVRKAGFSKVEILYTKESRIDMEIPKLEIEGAKDLEKYNEAMAEVSELLFGSQDYAVVATK